jgi:hypothetical protein
MCAKCYEEVEAFGIAHDSAQVEERLDLNRLSITEDRYGRMHFAHHLRKGRLACKRK